MRGLGGFLGLRRLVATALVVFMSAASSNAQVSASTPSPQAARGAIPIVVTLDKPADRQSYPSNAFVPIGATAVSVTRISRVELWVDGAMVAQRQPVGLQNRYSAYFSWQPGSTGERTVSVRAVDYGGAFADSLPVRIIATGVVIPRLLLESGSEESLQTIATRLKVPIDQVSRLNPGVDPDQLLPKGAAIFAPVVAGAGTGSMPPIATATPAVPSTQRVAPAVTRPLSTLNLVSGRLLADPTIEKVYYYVSPGDGKWRRVPEDPNSFVSPMSVDELKSWARGDSPSLRGRRAFEVAGKIGDLLSVSSQGGTEFSMEAWGWRAGELQYLGGFQQLVASDLLANPANFLSANSDLLVCVSGTTCPTNDLSIGWRSSDLNLVRGSGEEELRFLLRADATGWDGSSVWQVSTIPFTVGFDPVPPGLVATGATKYTSFTVDFAHLESTPPAASASIEPKAMVPTTSAAQGQDEETPLSAVFNGAAFGPSDGNSLTSVQPPAMLAAASKAVGTTTYYVRATPMVGNQPVVAPSNTIVIRRGPPPDDPGIQFVDPNEVLPGIFDVQVLDFKTFNPSSSGCAKIVRNEGKWPGSEVYQVGKIYCPAPFTGIGEKSWYESLLDFVSSGVDWIARAYDNIKQGVVDLVAMSIPYCSTSDLCKGVLSAGLDMAMMYAGVPPSLPSFAELGDMGESMLIDYVAEQAGVDCGPDSACQMAIKSAIAEKKQQALAGGSNEACLPEAEAHSLGFEPMCLPAGVVGVPVEGSMPHPASMKLKVTRRQGSPEVSDEVFARYRLMIGATAVNENYPANKPISVPVNYPRDSSTWALMCGIWPDEAKVTLDSPLSGSLFTHPSPGTPVSIMPSNLVNPIPPELSGPPALPVTVPRLKPGESMEMTVPLAPGQPFWIPGHKEAIQKAGGAVCYDDWFKLYQGGRLTASAEISCSPQNQWMTCRLDPPAAGRIEVDMAW